MSTFSYRSFRVLAVALLFAVASIASAHVVVTPATAPAASYQNFSISVPTERTSPTIKVALDIPAGVKDVTPFVKPGWKITMTKDANDDVTRIEWSGGSIPSEFKDTFQFGIKTPTEPTTLAWKAYQTYGDGEVVSWDQAPAPEKPSVSGDDDDSVTPYSQTTITKAMSDKGMMQGGIDDWDDGHGMPHGGALPLIVSIGALALSGYTFSRMRKMRK